MFRALDLVQCRRAQALVDAWQDGDDPSVDRVVPLEHLVVVAHLPWDDEGNDELAGVRDGVLVAVALLAMRHGVHEVVVCGDCLPHGLRVLAEPPCDS